METKEIREASILKTLIDTKKLPLTGYCWI